MREIYGLNNQPTRLIGIAYHLAQQVSGNNEYEGKVTYYLRCNEFIKIGATAASLNRITFFRAGNPYPLELLAIEAGDQERRRHAEFKDLRVQSEWFTSGPHLLNHIELLARPVREILEVYNQALGYNRCPAAHLDPIAKLKARVAQG
jgi:hypothetical protein